MADVAKTCPLEPTDNTTIEATTTMRSEKRENGADHSDTVFVVSREGGMYLMAEAANTCPSDPTDRTIKDATTTIISAMYTHSV